jgi:hypothetical protein
LPIGCGLFFSFVAEPLRGKDFPPKYDAYGHVAEKLAPLRIAAYAAFW